MYLTDSCSAIQHCLAFNRKYFNESYYYLDESSPSTPSPSVVPDWDAESSVSSSGAGSDGSSGGGKSSTSIPAHLYIQRVASLHAEGNLGFASEFQMVQSLSAQEEFAAEASHLPGNRSKNRYPNVVACKLNQKYNQWKSNRLRVFGLCLPKLFSR